MNWRMTIGDVKFALTLVKVTKVVGVNSRVENDEHLLMWDFDDVPLDYVKIALGVVMARYNLSDIYILRSSPPDNYIAYCFSVFPWRQAVEIVAQTERIDWNFFKFGVYRGNFTLRVSEKCGNTPKLVCRIEGKSMPDCTPEALTRWVRYETKKE